VNARPIGEEKYGFSYSECRFPSTLEDMALIGAARRSMGMRNAGGSSELSEALSMQFMHIVHGVTEFVPEMEVAYFIDYKMCDYLMRMGREQHANVGVSVTRAVAYPFGQRFTLEMARKLMRRKLYGLVVARECVLERDTFYNAVLHVWCHDEESVDLLRAAHAEVVAEDADRTYEDVDVVCTVCKQMFIYTNRFE
jgi:hypothetical protein